jgi:hypothetical protein
MGSSIGRLRWDLDNRESDVLFAVMGTGSPSREKTTEPTGNQIQAIDLGRDAALRVTLPNKKVEENGGDLSFLEALVRGLTGVLSFGALGLGVLWILRSDLIASDGREARQAWHDLAAGTYVVKVPKGYPLP